MRQRNYPSNPEHDKLHKLSWSAVRRLLSLALPYKWPLIVGSVLMLCSTAVNLALPWVAKQALDKVVASHSVASLNSLAAGIVGLVLAGAVFAFAQYAIVAIAGNRIIMDLRARMFSQLQRLPVAYFDKTRSGDLTSHLSNDVGLVQQTLTSDIATFAGNLVQFVGGIVVAVFIDWKLCLIVVGLLALVMAFFVFFGRSLRKLTRAQLDALSDTMGAMTEALSNIRLVKAFVREAHEDERASDRLKKVLALSIKSSIWEGMMGTVAFVGSISLLLGVVWYGGREAMAGSLTWGSLLAFFLTIMIISGPMTSLASLYTRLQRAVGAADRIFSIIDAAPEEPDLPGAVEFPAGLGGVEFQRIGFSYLTETPVLTGLSLDLPPGKVTALVGESGGGKTTLASLLYRFFEPQSGEILIDGVPIRNIRRLALREHLGIVPQDTLLFNGSIRENIRYGRLEATDVEVEQAARAANVEEFVMGFPDEYETTIGERGITLSGGQRQRVAIARALLKDPKILILDEATSALDTKSEALVREALERLMRGRTTLVIAHRLSTVQNADQIAVLDDGRIVERGTHDELLLTGGRYAELNNLIPSP